MIWIWIYEINYKAPYYVVSRRYYFVFIWNVAFADATAATECSPSYQIIVRIAAQKNF